MTLDLYGFETEPVKSYPPFSVGLNIKSVSHVGRKNGRTRAPLVDLTPPLKKINEINSVLILHFRLITILLFFLENKIFNRLY